MLSVNNSEGSFTLTQVLPKLNRLKSWQAAIIILIIGLGVYSTGLTNPFQGDDLSQIVNSVPVHSITHIRLFFEGGTFYNGQGLAPLSGVYFRPLMLVIFSLIYTLFGPHPVYFHLFQLLLSIGSTIILYLLFRYFFKPALALLLSLIFLLHPIDSQVLYAIPSMQDALFFFFGILALWMLLRFKSVGSLFLVATCLFLSLLGKETGILFVALSIPILYWHNRKRLYPFIAIMVLPLAAYLLLKAHAVGLLGTNPNNAPIDKLGLAGRLLTSPSIVLFYMTKLVFPWKLASAYYWVDATFSLRYFFLPLLLDLGVIAAVICLALLIRRRASKVHFHAYLLFATWSALGLLAHIQIIPLDFTASEPWFYFSMAGILGMIGVAFTTLAPATYMNRRTLLMLAVALLLLLGVRTASRGTDWSSQYKLATHDIAASKEDYVADNEIADYYYGQGNYNESKTYAARSVAVYPYVINYNTLGESLFALGNYSAAYAAFTSGARIKPYVPLYDNLAALTLFHGNASTNKTFLLSALTHFPQDPSLWTYLAILEDRQGDNADARLAITRAASYGQVPQFIYENIRSNQPFFITFAGKKVTV